MIAKALGTFCAQTRYDILPAPVREAIKLRVIDQLGVALAGYKLGTVSQMSVICEGVGEATFWGSGRRGGRRDAALVNAFMSHACYMEDGSRYTGGHAASVVIPPAFVMAESERSSGKEFIASLAVGYEVFLRLGRAMYPSIVRRGFQSTSVLGGISSAAACASLLHLRAPAAANAIALGTMTSVGYKESVKSTASQPFQAARAAEGGLVAALLAQAGTQASNEIIEKGLFKGFADGVQAVGVLDGLGERFSVEETYLKLHGGCRGNHAPIDVICSIVEKHGIDIGEIARMRVSVDTITFAEDIRGPRDGLQAQQSMSFAIAAHLCLGDASSNRYTDGNLSDPSIRSLMERIEVSPDPALDEGFPDRRPAAAVVTLGDRRAFKGRVELARGEPESPLTADEVKRKFLGLASSEIGAHRAQELYALVEHLEELPDVRPIAALLVC